MTYTTKKEPTFTKDAIALDDMILTKDSPTTAGSKMLEGYTSLFDATVAEKLSEDYEILGKVAVSEFALGMLADSAATALDEKEIKAVVGLDANGAYRRTAALTGKVFVKPTYGTVSRFGLIPVACSGDTVGVMADGADEAKEVLGVIAGHDDKDGTSLPQEVCAAALDAGTIKKIAVVKDFTANLSAEMTAKVDAAIEKAKAQGAEIIEVDGGVLSQAKLAWAILSSAEFCNNVSRYDGVKYGYRAKGCHSIEEIYVRSRSETFGSAVKSAILYGSHVLSTDNYDKMYDKALRVRRLVKAYFDELFTKVDAVLLPACSKTDLSATECVYEESKYTAPASITGLPVVVAAGVQWLGKPLADGALLAFSKQLA
ncbi:MAG: hypothetical protein IKC37_01330 [Clostridia bacterium]|nr:hypothetical protein [Clostridia bacterium]